ncbi:MAG TPA: pyridoxal 5'-phosphate synthase glutaminase subunit PdxT [Planctomycetota bacterium]|nr:pyridoxal 5'-phosphate synthase glutaminase subunit PdxT [Planctomycetota bacterium]
MIGVLALQGAFSRHLELLRLLGVEGRLVRTPEDLGGVSGLVLPGGESSVHLRLLDESSLLLPPAKRGGGRVGGSTQRTSLYDALGRFEGPILGTCAGAILLARRVTNPEQRSLDLIDIDVERNAYGRQRESFEDEEGRVFIRAPRITRIGEGVEVLARRGDEPVAVRQGRMIAATFHPELAGDTRLHALLVEETRRSHGPGMRSLGPYARAMGPH